MELEEAINFLENYLDKEDRKFVSKYRLIFLESIEILIKYIKEESIPRAVVEGKLKSRISNVDKCYKKEIEPYQTEYGLNTSLLNKKEKEELINKRNCLLVQKHCYNEILQEILNKGE